MDTTALLPLARFRAAFYRDVLGLRRDALFDLLDAVLTDAGPTSLVRRSLNPGFSRGWASTCDALADGSFDTAAARWLFVGALPPPPAGERELWALDGTTWPRPAAKTSPERTWCRMVTAGQPAEGVVPGWEWQWLGRIAAHRQSWVLPLDIARRGPAAGSPTQLAIAQLRRTLKTRAADAPRPVVATDSHYDVAELIAAGLGCDLLVRLSSRRRFFRRPPPYAGKGAPRKHGPVFRTHAPQTQGTPDRTQTVTDPARGWVRVDVWEHLHGQGTEAIECAVVRVTVGRLARRETPPDPLWLAWHGELPGDLSLLWRWYEQRFPMEHLFRFLKQDLGWTAIQVRFPGAAVRWTWLLAAGVWQLWLAREAAAETALPWEKSQPVAQRSPGRVRRDFARLVRGLTSPVRPPRSRGKSPGRPPGEGTGRRQRFPIHRRGPPRPR
jgi:DDE superfamily endonuclease